MGVILIFLGIFIVFFGTSPLLIWEHFKDYLLNDKSRSWLIVNTIFSVVPIWSHIALLIYYAESMGDDDPFQKYIKKLNNAYKCKTCNITSREYQIKDGYWDGNCPHCDNSMYRSTEVKENSNYPFAPKISMRGAINNKLHERKLTNIRQKLNETENSDKEMESWQKINLEKLKDLETKANEIKNELTQKGMIKEYE